MKNKFKRITISFLCIFLSFSILFTTSCTNSFGHIDSGNANATLPTTTTYDTTKITTSTETTSWIETTETPIQPTPEKELFEDYAPDETQNFIYRLVYSELDQKYDTFTGYIRSESRTRSIESIDIYGISYVDYEEAYVDSIGKTYFSAGFLRFSENPSRNNAKIANGSEIISLEENIDSRFSYVYAYSTTEAHKHCVYNQQYIKYDIINDEIQYTAEPFEVGMDVDFTRGNIYNYDTKEYVYIVEEQGYIPVAGVSLIGEADYQSIIDEVNRILREQEANFSYAEIQSYVSQSQTAFRSYLAGLQDETFMGFSASKLIQAAENLDPMQHLRIAVDPNGYPVIHIVNITKLPSVEEKIITSLICTAGIIGSIVIDEYVKIAPLNPPVTILLDAALKIVTDTIIEASLEIFCQVVLNDIPIADIQWKKYTTDIEWEMVATKIISSVISSAICSINPELENYCEILFDNTDILVDSLITGKPFDKACQDYGYVTISSLIISSIIPNEEKISKPITKIFKKNAADHIINIGTKFVKKITEKALDVGISELMEKTIFKNALTNTQNAIANDVRYYDDNGKLYRIGENLLPDMQYTIEGYTYTTDALGRKIRVTGNLHLSDARNEDITDTMEVIGKNDQMIGDRPGYLISSRFGGTSGAENLFPMDSDIQTEVLTTIENEWINALKNKKNVFVKIDLYYDNQSFRPKGFTVCGNIDGASFEVIIENYPT